MMYHCSGGFVTPSIKHNQVHLRYYCMMCYTNTFSEKSCNHYAKSIYNIGD